MANQPSQLLPLRVKLGMRKTHLRFSPANLGFAADLPLVWLTGLTHSLTGAAPHLTPVLLIDDSRPPRQTLFVRRHRPQV
jgi:hypothetical protein